MEVSSIDDIKYQGISADAVYIGDLKIWGHGIYEYTGFVPFAIKTDGTPIIDWQIFGSENGIGVMGMNKLSQREYTDADGLSNESSTNPYNITITYHSYIFSVPPDSSKDADYAQWYAQSTWYLGEANRRDGYTTDDRPCDYEHCQFFADLKAGSYKLICEAYVDTDRYPWVIKTHDNENPYVALVSENNEILVKKSMNQSYCPTISEPLFNGYNTTANKFYHEEYPFVVDNDISVGLISKIYAPWNNNIDIRFQIVNADVVAEPFTVTTQYETFSGVTCWEPYQVELTLNFEEVKNPENSQQVTLILPKVLYEEDSVSMSDLGVNLPTYLGKTKISIVDDSQEAQMYVKYKW